MRCKPAEVSPFDREAMRCKLAGVSRSGSGSSATQARGSFSLSLWEWAGVRAGAAEALRGTACTLTRADARFAARAAPIQETVSAGCLAPNSAATRFFGLMLGDSPRGATGPLRSQTAGSAPAMLGS